MSYLKAAASGVVWIGLMRGVTRGISFGKAILLARLLTPEQFGVFGVVALTMSLLEVITETGVNTVLVQLREEVHSYINSAWVVSIVRGVFIFLIMLVAANPVAQFFQIQESASLIVFAALIPLVRGFINPSEVNFQKELLFKKEFIFRTTIFLLDSFISIILAVILRSPIAFIWGLLAGAILEVILSHIFLTPHPRLSFEKEKVIRILNRGKWLTFSGVTDYITQNGDNIIVGRLLGSVQLGFYQMAYQISTLPVAEISNILSKVTFPVFMKFADDRAKLMNAYMHLLRLVILLAGLSALVLIVLTEPIVGLLLGNQWISIIPVLRVLAVFAFIKSIVLSSYAFFLSIEKQERVSIISASGFIAMFIVIIPLVIQFGIVGAALAATVGSFCALLVMIVSFKYRIKI